jgi:uncharacterized membrane protein
MEKRFMTTVGWLMMATCWIVITFASVYLIYKTIVTPRQDDE